MEIMDLPPPFYDFSKFLQQQAAPVYSTQGPAVLRDMIKGMIVLAAPANWSTSMVTSR